jgi:hypothetical protein
MVRQAANFLKSPFFLYSVLISLLFLLLKGYQLNTDDQAEHLPQVYRMMDSSLYTQDFFVSAASENFTVRTYYTWLIYFLSFLAPVSAVCFVLTVVCIAMTCHAFMKITALWSNQPAAPYLSPLLIFFVLYNFAPGGNHIQYPLLICSSLAKAFCAQGLLHYLSGKYRTSALLLGLGSLFQVIAGLQLFLVLACVLLLHKEQRQHWRKFSALYLLTALPMLGPIAYRQIFRGAGEDRELFYQILYVFRNPHHYLPSLFPLKDYLKFLLLMGTTFLCLHRISGKGRTFVSSFFAVAGSGLLLYFLLLETAGFSGIGRLQWFKMTIWMCALGGMALSSTLTALVPERLLSGMSRGWRGAAVAGIVIFTAVLTLSEKLPLRSIQGKYAVGLYRKSDLTRMHEWIAAHTPRDAVFIVPPDDHAFLCEAKRAVAVAYKPVIHEPFFLLPWYRRFGEVYGVTLENREGGVLARAAEMYAEELRKPANFRVDYRIDNIKSCKFTVKLNTPVHREGDWILTTY